MGIVSWFKKLFDKYEVTEETRYLSFSESPVSYKVILKSNAANHYFAVRLKDLCIKDELPEYINIKKFILKYYDETLPNEFDLDKLAVEPTSEIKKLAHKWVLLGYKCADKDFDEFMKSLL